MMIIGAGLAGLVAAHAFPKMPVFEAAPEPKMSHRALLRFRSDAVARLTGVEFKAVNVRKGIWREGAFREPTILDANLYSHKCLGSLVGERSIWNLDPVTRYVAPVDFHDQLVESVGYRLNYDSPCEFKERSPSKPIISTVPMDLVLSALKVNVTQKFQRAGIHVRRYTIPDCDVYQTVYFTDPEHDLYRASITGSTLIAEFAGPPEESDFWQSDLRDAFWLRHIPKEDERIQQRYGKIAPIDEAVRKSLVAFLTERYGIFSIGRFATWRNILLDDVVQDTEVLKRLIKSSAYDRRIAAL